MTGAVLDGNIAPVVALPDRTLVIRFGRIGDILVVTPVLRALRRASPTMRVDMLTTDEGRAVLAHNPNVTAVHVLRARRPHRLINPERRRLERHLSALLFDAVVLLEGAERYRDLAGRIGARRVYGYARRDAPAGPHEAERGSGHELDNAFAVLERMGVAPDGVHYDFPVPGPARARADRLLAGAAGRPVIGVHAGFHRRRFQRRTHAKAWPVERWADVVGRLARGGERCVVLTGSRREAGLNRAILRRLPPGLAVDLAGRTDLDTLAGLISRCAVFVAPDTGPAHLAAAVRTPLVALFGPKAPHIMGPLGDDARIIRLYPEPSPSTAKERAGHHPRMWAITAEDVVAAAERVCAVAMRTGRVATERMGP